MVNQSLRPYIISDFYNIKEYLKRLCYSYETLNVTDFNLRDMFAHFNSTKLIHIQHELGLNFDEINETQASLLDIQNYFCQILEYFESRLKIIVIDDQTLEFYLKTIGEFYNFCSNIHFFIDQDDKYHIETPRPVLMSKSKVKPLVYSPNKPLIKEILENQNNIIAIGPVKVNRHYKYVADAKKAVSVKDYESALSLIERALNHMRTAQTLTFQGWVYSLMEKFDEAIESCKQAIELDPDYGNPYNDIGSYLLVQQKVGKSIPWFKQAQAAAKYTNREYPYINMGKSFLMLGRYSLALEQFKKAKTLVPKNQNVLDTIKKVEDIIKKEDLHL